MLRAIVKYGLSMCALLALGCTLPDSCPKDTVREKNRCIAVARDSEPTPVNPGEGDDAGASPDSGQQDDSDGDAGENSDPDAEPDATDDGASPMDASGAPEAESDGATGADATLDTGGGEEGSQPIRTDADSSDGSGEPADARTDAQESGVVTNPFVCGEDALATWRRFQLGNLALLETERCYRIDPECADAVCDISSCMRSAAQISGCEACIRGELECMAKNCLAQCSGPDSFEFCRACACSHHCMEATRGCGESSVDVCGDCELHSCKRISVIPPIIMQVVDQSLILMPPL